MIYDAIGREIKTLVNQNLQPGSYEADFNGSNLPTGIYYYRLKVNGFFDIKKMVLVK